MPYVPRAQRLGKEPTKKAVTQTASSGYVPRAQRLGSTPSKTTTTAPKPKLNELEGLKLFAEQKGVEVPKEKKPGLFTRAMDILSRPVYASAGAAKAILQPELKENPLMEAWKGLKGEDKETYSDVLAGIGVENKWVKGGVGFALDVALDPTTYFGGAIVKGALKGAKTAGKTGLEVSRAIRPTTVAKLETAGKSLKDALGTAFDVHYGLTKKGGETVADELARFVNKTGISKEAIVTSNFKALNIFDKKTIGEAADVMFKNKSIERNIREGAKGLKFIKPEGDVAKAVGVMKEIGKRIGAKTGIPEEKLFENYIPSLLKERLPGVKKGLEVGKEGYLKKFMDKIEEKALLKKPIEAYSRREFEVVRDNLARDTMQGVIQTFGKAKNAFKTVQEASEAGYKLVKDKKFGKTLGYLKENDWKYLNNVMFPEMKTIDLLAKATGYDGATRLFKTAVTAYFPAFHVRNFISGNVQNYSVLGAEALNPKNIHNGLGIIKGVDKTLTFPKWTGTGKELNKILQENFGGASRYISDLGNYIDDLGAKGFSPNKLTGKLNPKQVGNFIEQWQKATAVSTALKQGKTMQEAIKLAEKAGFDYSKITQFESKVLRRMIPFYTFARKNAELQLSTAMKNPERILNQIKFTKALGNIFGGKPTEDDLKGLPPWALNGLGFKVSGSRFLTQFGLPVEEFTNRIDAPGQTTLSALNPLIKYPAEAKLGFDFFREKKIIDIDTIAPATGELILNKAPKVLRDILNVKKTETPFGTKYYASPQALHVLRNLPTARLQNTLEKMFDGDMNKVDKWLAFLTGARIYDINLEEQKYFTERDLKTEIENQLLKRGDIKEGKYLFEAK